jgi:hypothetical protein
MQPLCTAGPVAATVTSVARMTYGESRKPKLWPPYPKSPVHISEEDVLGVIRSLHLRHNSLV